MKPLFTLTFITLLLAVSSTSCAQSRHATDTFDVEDFSSIEASMVSNIRITQSNVTSVSAEGSEELLDILDVRMENGRLILKMEDRYRKKFRKNANKMTISITTPTLTRIDSEGVGNITIDGSFSSPELIIQSEGVGNITAENLRTQKVVIDSQGVGNITLGGTADNVDISRRVKSKTRRGLLRGSGQRELPCNGIPESKFARYR